MSGLFSPTTLVSYAVPLLVFFATLMAGYVLRRIIFNRLQKWSRHTASPIDDIVIGAVKGPFIIWCVMLGVYFALEISQVPEEIVHMAGKILFALGVLSVSVAFANIVTQLINAYSRKVGNAFPVTSLTQNIARIVIFTVGVLIILNGFGVPITPMLATLGIGGLAVALALQDTLSNLFSGFYIIASRQIKVGDYIKLESGEEGYVTDITWRATKIRMLSNNVVLVPNTKLTQAIITNYYLPDTEMAVLVEAGVHYASDLRKVEAVTCEVAKQVMQEVQGGVERFEPFVRYHTFGDSNVKFTVILRAKEFVDQYLIKHEFIKRLHARYVKEGIVIAYPIRAINYDQEKSIVSKA